jgi:predicted acyltransferase
MRMTAPPDPGRSPSPRSPATQALTGSRERLLSLDVFRGMTVAGMLLVNNPGDWGHIFAPLEHAAWHGWTPTDLIFPFFLFIVGVTSHLSLSQRRARGDDDTAIVRQVLKRGALIFLFGVFLSWFPGFMWGTIESIPNATFGDRVLYRLEHLRIMGVLQRIGVAYVIGALITLRGGWRQHLVILLSILLGYWALMTLVVVPDQGVPGWQLLDRPDAVLSAWFDRTILTTNHLWASAKTWDPEGLLSTLPAVGSMMIGQFAGRWIGSPRPIAERLNAMFAIGALLLMVGLMWHWVFPINKSLWTSSYVHGGHGTGDAGDLHVGHRRAPDSPLDDLLRYLWHQPDDRISGVGAHGPAHRHAVEGPDRRRPGIGTVGDLPVGVRADLRTTRGVAGVCPVVRGALVRDPVGALAPQYFSQGLATWLVPLVVHQPSAASWCCCVRCAWRSLPMRSGRRRTEASPPPHGAARVRRPRVPR